MGCCPGARTASWSGTSGQGARVEGAADILPSVDADDVAVVPGGLSGLLALGAGVQAAVMLAMTIGTDRAQRCRCTSMIRNL